MNKTLVIGWLLAALGAAVQADTLAKIKETGVATMGVRESSGVLSYVLADGKYVGFHVDVCQRVLADIQNRLGLARLDVQFMPVTSQNRSTMLMNGRVDIECGSTTNSAQRQKDVAFALTTYVEEVRVAVKVDAGIASLKQLDGRNVSTTTGTTAVQAMRRYERAAGVDFKEVFGKDHADSFLLLQTGRADAFVMDSQILAGNIAQAENPGAYRILGEVLAVEPIAIMLRKGDPAFKQAVDESLRAMMKSGDLARLYDKWFLQPIPPSNKPLGLPVSEATRTAWIQPNDRPVEDYGRK